MQKSVIRMLREIFQLGLPAFLAASFLCVGCGTLHGEPGDVKDQRPEKREILKLRQRADTEADDPRAHYELGNALYDARRYNEALEAYTLAVEADPGFSDAYTNIGLTHRQLNDLEAAIENYERSLALAPGDATTLQNMVIALRAAGDLEAAVEYLYRLAGLRPQDVALRSDLAVTLFNLERYGEARAQFQRLMDLKPRNVDARFNLGSCYYFLDEWENALITWAELVAQDRNHGPAHRGMAMAHWRLGDYDAAWRSVGECERIGIRLSSKFIAQLQADSGRLGPE